MNLIYFENIPLLELRAPCIKQVDDPKLKTIRSSFAHVFESWSSLYKIDIFETLKQDGQLNPSIACFENNMWKVEPGQARWLAMYELGIKTQKVVLIENKQNNELERLKTFDHIRIKDKEQLKSLFILDDNYHTGYHNINKRYKRFFGYYFDSDVNYS